ncbi:MAG: PA4642 family protein [Moraxellaceae bacterium]|nr:PA4642 family protein [Pseudomonadales bacterium]MCP5174113.1 PA4642 family protein [Moraxellaceae bacterium]MCP5176301.1 PA4642 family protein [Moraxellaceae bacterium]HQV22519.1 PA4642 family protein [Agitococcus sp.]
MAFAQPATFNEQWSDERVKSYLNRQAPTGENADFNALYIAYKHMRPADFERFLVFFKADGRDVNAKNAQGLTFAELIKQHPHAREFVALLDAA